MVQFISKKIVTVGRSRGITIPKALIDAQIVDLNKPLKVTIENIEKAEKPENQPNNAANGLLSWDSKNIGRFSEILPNYNNNILEGSGVASM